MNDLYFERSERSVTFVVRRIITHYILRAQVLGNLSRNLRHLAQIFGKECAASGIVGQSRKQLFGLFSWGAAEERALILFFINEANKVDLYLVLLDRFHDLFFLDRAVLLKTVSNDDQRLAPLFALFLGIIRSRDDGIEQGCSATGEQFAERIFQFTPV